MKRFLNCTVVQFTAGVYLLLLLTFEVTAQNASYNSNTIPIGGTYSTAFGWEALKVNVGGYNTANGHRALVNNNTGANNTANGVYALFSNSTGNDNSANGRDALYSNTSGNKNTANGFRSLYYNITGCSNVGIGNAALYRNTIQNGLVAVGDSALYNNGNGATQSYESSCNTAIGTKALQHNSTGHYNSAIGFEALHNNTKGYGNSANGHGALQRNTTGSRNTGNGFEALNINSTGNENTVNGSRALMRNNTGDNNTADGFEALLWNSTGSNNVALGGQSGYSSQGNGNIYIGYQAGYNETGSNKFYLGNDGANALMYGDMATRQILLGNANPTGYTFMGTRTLNVMGGVLADSVRVALSIQWADYVFDENYKLRSLDDLNQFIKTNRHLPGIPTVADVKAEGIELGEMNARLLEKIEELTLYVIDLKREIDRLKENGRH